MSVLRDHPYLNFHFLVDLGDGVVDGAQAGATEVIFPDAKLLTVDHRSGNSLESARAKLQTTTQYGNLVLRRATHGSLNWYQWWNELRNGDARGVRTVRITLLNEDRSNPVLSWRFLRARPVNHHFAPLNGLQPAALVETLEIGFDRLELE